MMNKKKFKVGDYVIIKFNNTLYNPVLADYSFSGLYNNKTGTVLGYEDYPQGWTFVKIKLDYNKKTEIFYESDVYYSLKQKLRLL